MAWPAANRRSTTQALLSLAALAAISFLFVGGGWVNDDFAHVLRLQQVPSTARIFSDADAFDFYRPLAQWSLWAQGRLHGFTPSLFRAANVVLHIAICIAAYLVGRRLVSERAAWLATLAFALTPKATTVAVLWASARPELLMSLFVLVAALAWLRWNERGGWPIALVTAAYLLAFMSKETAALLPIVLLTMVPRESRPTSTERSLAIAALLVAAAIPIVLRMRANALMPTSSHEHYQLDFSFHRMLRSLEVYLPRALPSPIGLFVFVGLPALLIGKRAAANGVTRQPASGA